MAKTKTKQEPDESAIVPTAGNPLFPRLHRLRAAGMAMVSDSFGHLGLGAKQAFFVRFLSQYPCSSPGQFAQFTGTDSAAVVRLVDSLEKKGLLKRADDPNDRRKWTLTLTPAGKRVEVEVARTQEKIKRRITGAMSKREMSDLLALLDKVIAALEGTSK